MLRPDQILQTHADGLAIKAAHALASATLTMGITSTWQKKTLPCYGEGGPCFCPLPLQPGGLDMGGLLVPYPAPHLAAPGSVRLNSELSLTRVNLEWGTRKCWDMTDQFWMIFQIIMDCPSVYDLSAILEKWQWFEKIFVTTVHV